MIVRDSDLLAGWLLAARQPGLPGGVAVIVSGEVVVGRAVGKRTRSEGNGPLSVCVPVFFCYELACARRLHDLMWFLRIVS